MNLFKKLKFFFGFFALNEFEERLILLLKENISDKYIKVINSQLSKFNKVDRVVFQSDELPFGHTSFYWTKFGKARFDFPLKFPMEKESEELATVDVFCSDGNLIKVSYVLVRGFLFTIKYRSKIKVFQPRSEYEFSNFKIHKSLN
ncbi:MAG: hypothetical protein B0W54_15145 [Cellvibrio sp. 79]|nr:MAG: hypothetical protein B0W54_15145 [Cellvibrio sp. 79]